MIRSLLMAAIAGMRAMTPLAVITNAARKGELPADNGAPAIVAHPLVSAGALAIGAGELAGDKMPSAPDRIVPAGMAARLATGALAGVAFAPKRQRILAGALGAAVACGSAYVTWKARCAAIRRFGQVPTGAIEDALALGGAIAIARAR